MIANPRILLPLLASALLAAALPAAAALAQTHAPHEHGAARLNLVVEDDGFAAELEGALAGFISFEHPPSTDAQRAEVRDMAAKLGGGAGDLFQAPAEAGCSPAAIAMGSANLPQELLEPYPAPAGHGHGHDADHGHDGDHGHEADHDHDAEADHDHDGEAGHDHGEADHDHHAEGDHDHAGEAGHDHAGEAGHDHAEGDHVHSDLEAAWDFKCSNPAALTRLTIGLFDAFPGLEEIDVQIITPSGQAAAELTPADKVVKW